MSYTLRGRVESRLWSWIDAGAFNVAAEPPLDGDVVAGLLAARAVEVPARVLRAGAALSWRLRLQPTEPGWVAK